MAALLFIFVVGMTFGQVRVASAAQDTQARVVVTKQISLAEQNRAAALWTREAIANAQAFTMPVDSGAGGESTPPGVPDALGQLGFSSAAGKAATNANAVARKTYAEDWSALADASSLDAPADDMAGTSQVYTSYIVNSWAPAQVIYPHKWVGRLSFSTTGGTSYCSATSISGNNFVTAAHCVYDTTNNVWYSNWAFTPAYRNGSAPYGTFVATFCTILTSWINLSGSFSINGWTKYDVAVCSVRTNSAGQTLNAAVGWAGRQWNYGYVRNFFDLGYPFRDFNNTTVSNAGLYLRTCTAESFQRTTDTLGMGCNWGPGISGGPWLIGYYPTLVSGAVNSVNSGLVIGQANLYGIRFTSNNIVPICTARGC
jgi:V8-like Glu-specific endopeptidase